LFIIGNLIEAIARVLGMVLNIYMFIIIVRALASWFSMDPYNPLYQFLIRITEPVLWRVRKYLPAAAGVDFSPIVVILIIYFLQAFVVQSLLGVAVRLR
jgi:YggT family protein